MYGNDRWLLMVVFLNTFYYETSLKEEMSCSKKDYNTLISYRLFPCYFSPNF